MRKIEQQMIEALKAGKALNKGNMAVTERYKVSHGYAAQVRLHGNLIAVAEFWGTGREYPYKLRVTLAGWPTVTTRSRLNALGRAFAGGAVANQHKHEQYINDVPVSSDEWVELEVRYG